MRATETLSLLAGRGIEGDRYLLGTGYYSGKPEEGRQVTLFEVETLEALQRDYDIVLTAAEHRRNVTVAGVALNHLVGRRLRIGDAVLEATRLSIPCRYIEEVTGKSIFKALMHRSGLNCKILHGGAIHPGDAVVAG
jgi:MOSC domain-containing protein YiiM